ncbi:MAG TPA: glycerol-3-phosphate dehydrogenase C-terminal domain-containing protein, partial [Cyclobacteriaceae bacterium]|nr:glycerol-3-phosphate dehydrogenase C-terminal domain-containing protein [Cyclobacteriaceae bacterium]
RKDEIFISNSGLISIAGGKLTGYRKMAERVVDLVIKKYFEEKELKKCNTDKVRLSGSEFDNAKDVMEYQKRTERQLRPYGLESFSSYLVANYGRNTNLILDQLSKQEGNKDDLSLAKAELWYGINHEMVISPLDFFVRRTGMLFFHVNRLKNLREPILSEFRQVFNWDDHRMNTERDALDKVIAEATLRNI